MNGPPARLTRYLLSTTTNHTVCTHPRAERVRSLRRFSKSSSSCFPLFKWIGQPALKVQSNGGGEDTHPRSDPPSSLNTETSLTRPPSQHLPTKASSQQQPPVDARVSLRPHRSRLVLRSGGFGIPKPHPTAYNTPHPPLPSSSAPTSISSSTTSSQPPTLWPVSSTNPESLRVSVGGTRAVQVGEDAYFFARSSMGVSDGVAGVKNPNRNSVNPEMDVDHSSTTSGSDKKVNKGPTTELRELRPDPARFSQLLMHFCATEADALETQLTRLRKTQAIRSNIQQKKIRFESSNLDEGIVEDEKDRGEGMEPIEIMQKAYEYTVDYARSEGIIGAATCLIAVLDGKELKIANLGDCALIVVRSGQVVFRIEEMQHGFNYPMALGTKSKEEPMKDAQLSKFEVEKGDIVIMGSDGLSDNLFETEILDVLSTFSSPSSRNRFHSPDPSDYPSLSPSSSSQVKIAFTPQRVAESLCLAANSASRDIEGYSPFMGKAVDRGYSFVGGKQDDISVLVALIDGI